MVVTYYDNKKDFGIIGTFNPFPELNSIKNKVFSYPNFISFSNLIYSSESYKFSEQLHIDFPEIKYQEINGKPTGILSKGHDNDIVTNIFSKLPQIFVDKKYDDDIYAKFLGLIGNKRYFKFIKEKYIKPHPNFQKYKVILPKSNGSGALGETLSNPLVGNPLVGHTQSFISIGAFNIEDEAQNCLKYIKTKFTRAMLGILKVTQNNPPGKWKYVPLQDFTSNSDIDWTQGVHKIDLQLYNKYGLDENEIDFIETHVKEMD